MQQFIAQKNTMANKQPPSFVDCKQLCLWPRRQVLTLLLHFKKRKNYSGFYQLERLAPKTGKTTAL